MNVLVVCTRFPERGQKGDQLRSREQIELLSVGHQVTVLTSGRPSDANEQRVVEQLARVRIVAAGRFARALSALGGLACGGRPLQVGWMAPRALSQAAAREAAHCDVVLVSTIRALPRALAAPTVLDHVDALSANMAERAQLAGSPVVRLGARLEARLLRAHELRAAGWIAAQTVVSPIDAAALPPSPSPLVLPLVWEEVVPPGDRVERDIDVILTGNMRYPPNRDAARWLAGEIVPRLRERHPSAVVLIAGRAADSLRLAGVEVASDVPDLRALMMRAKVAAVPLRNGTGVPIKLLEAVACGATVVCTPWVARAADLDVDTAEEAGGFARAIARLLTDEALRTRRTAAARAGLEARGPGAVGAALECVLCDAAADGAMARARDA